LGEMAAEFDHVHSVHRALEVGALHNIIPPKDLRPYLIAAIARGIEREEAARAHETKAATSALLEEAVLALQEQ